MIRFLFYCLVAYLLFRLFSLFRKTERTPASKPPTAAAGTMVKDDVCNTYLPREKAIREMIDGEERFFCSSECRRKGLEERNRGR